MSGEQTVIDALEHAIASLLARMGEVSPDAAACVRVGLLDKAALALCLELAEQSAEQWSVGSLREALRNIRTACRYVDDVRQALADQMVMDPEERRGLARVYGLSEDASAGEVMAAMAKRAPGPDDDGPPPVPAQP
jgi:hypothetical protein